MPKKTRIISLTEVEIDHLLQLIEGNEREGSYFGNREQYRKRSERIRLKLEPLDLSSLKKYALD